VTGILVGLVPRPPEWTELALCAQSDPEAWYPEKGGSTREAKRICRNCPVRAEQLGGTGECLDYALEHQERFGIWGGVSERERRMMTHNQQATNQDHGAA
jgi:WhiB family redox-sensing transcriptional regulator